jgi:ribosome-binding factor A
MKSFRPERVAHVVRSVVSEAITSRLNDPRIEPLSSVTRVEVTADLEYAKVWVSVMGSEAVGRRTIAGLRSATGFVQGLVAKELAIRVCPRLSFHLDESIKKGEQTLRLIEQVMAESRPATPSPDEDEDQPQGQEPAAAEGDSQ